MTSVYAETYRRSLERPEEFWAEAAEAIDWERRWDRVLDASRPPFYRWFPGARLNTCWNALDRHLAALEDLEHLVDLVGANQLAQTDRARITGRDHDLHSVLENLEDVKRLLVAGDLTRLDADNLRNAVGRIDGQITHSESRLHD